MKKIIESIAEALQEVQFNQDTQQQYLDESSLSRIYNHTKGRALAIISADRTDRGVDTPKKNNIEKYKLIDDLKDVQKKSGYGFIHGRGGYVEGHGTPDAKDATGERSFVVVGPNHDDGGKFLEHVKKLGQKYGQESILHKPHDSEDASWHYTDPTDARFGQSQSLGKFHQDNKAMYYTTISGQKKKFTFGD